MFVAYFCGKRSSMTPITKHMNNEIKQDMIKQKKCFTDEKIFIDIRCYKGYTDRIVQKWCRYQSNNFTYKGGRKKMRLKVLAYSQAEYWYAIKNRGNVFTYKNYSIKKDEDIAD